MHTYRQTDIHTYIHTYRHTDIQTYRHTDIQTYRHTHIHTYIHTYTHTHTHIYIYIIDMHTCISIHMYINHLFFFKYCTKSILTIDLTRLYLLDVTGLNYRWMDGGSKKTVIVVASTSPIL